MRCSERKHTPAGSLPGGDPATSYEIGPAEVSDNIGDTLRRSLERRRLPVQDGDAPPRGQQLGNQMRTDKPAAPDDEGIGTIFTQCLNHRESAYEQGKSSQLSL
jgi:hypothetical protein